MHGAAITLTKQKHYTYPQCAKNIKHLMKMRSAKYDPSFVFIFEDATCLLIFGMIQYTIEVESKITLCKLSTVPWRCMGR
jgi:hypothetical protein